MNILIMSLQCGLFIFIPLATFIVGIWKIIPSIKERYRSISISALIGFIFFEAAIIGSLIEPRAANKSFQEILTISLGIGVFVFLFILLFTPVYVAITKAFKK